MNRLKKAGQYYHIELRPRDSFIGFKTQEVCDKGHVLKIIGKRSTGSWETAGWLVSKNDASVSTLGNLIIHHPKARVVLESIYGPITQKAGDFFKAMPRYNANTRPSWSINHTLLR